MIDSIINDRATPQTTSSDAPRNPPPQPLVPSPNHPTQSGVVLPKTCRALCHTPVCRGYHGRGLRRGASRLGLRTFAGQLLIMIINHDYDYLCSRLITIIARHAPIARSAMSMAPQLRLTGARVFATGGYLADVARDDR